MAEKYARERAALRKNSKAILEGSVLYVDPSSTSLGYAISEQGEFVSSGCFDTKGDIGFRLRHMWDCIKSLGEFDVLVIEKIRGSRSHAFLFWSVGMAAACVGKPVCEIPWPMWKVMIDDQYVKGDEIDAIYISRFVLAFSKGEIS